MTGFRYGSGWSRAWKLVSGSAPSPGDPVAGANRPLFSSVVAKSATSLVALATTTSYLWANCVPTVAGSWPSVNRAHASAAAPSKA